MLRRPGHLSTSVHTSLAAVGGWRDDEASRLQAQLCRGQATIGMADIILTQADADALLGMEKLKAEDIAYPYPSSGGALRVPLHSADRRELFTLDVTRNQIKLTKGTYQNRGRGVAVLARVDFGGPPHRNPDDQEIPCPHLHLYREGFGDKWAVPLPAERFTDPSDPWLLLLEFMRFVNITAPPDIRKDLFT